jgi:hypothetical protein
MDRGVIQRHLCDVLRDIQVESGQTVPELGDDTVPNVDLPGFDSLAGVDASVRLSERMGVEVDLIPFKSPKTGKDMSIKEIVAALAGEHGSKKSRRTRRKGPGESAEGGAT